jgi:DUF971 family protein
MPAPTRLVADGSCLKIWWDDQVTTEVSWLELRRSCPCATCRVANSAPRPASDRKPSEGKTIGSFQSGGLPVLSLAEAQPLRAVGLIPAGNYACGIHFSDGHNTGIYNWDLLRRLGSPVGNPSEPPTQ